MLRSRRAPLSIVITIAGIVGLVFLNVRSPHAAQPPRVSSKVWDHVAVHGRARVIVQLKLPDDFVPEGLLPSSTAVVGQRQSIGAAVNKILARLAPGDRMIRTFATSPHVVLDVGPAALTALENAEADVLSVTNDDIVRPVLADSVPLVQADQVWAAGYNGAGQTIAIVDSGVDRTHPFLAGKVIEEACYSSAVDGLSESFCPNGQPVQIGPGSAAPCPLPDCIHGTHVAGIAAGNGVPAGIPFSGVARGAQLMAVQVFSRIIDPVSCGGLAPCVGGFTSDVIAGLERVYVVAGQRAIASVNMSLGGGSFAAPCDNEPYKPIIDNLRAIGIAAVVASGNDAFTNSISTPACVSSAVSVGSTSKDDEVSWFTNVAPFLSLFAPGESITSSIPGGGYAELSGTSMAAPHVAGSWALIKQAAPTSSVTTVLAALRQTGLPITDTRFFGTTTVPRIRIFEALARLVPVTNPLPAIASLSPNRGRAGGPITFTVNGSGFDAFSVVRWNGIAKSTTVVSTTQLRATIPASDVPNGGTTVQVSVSTPPPGGGASSSLSFAIDPPATLTPNALSVVPGGAETVTLANGFGGATDWIGLYSVGSADTSFIQWTYVGAGNLNRDWTVTMPTSGGPFEFRLFLNNTYTRAATSASISLDASLNPQPVVRTLVPASAAAGSAAFTLTVNGTGFVASSVVRWNGSNRPTTFGGATQLQAAIAASDLATAGSVPITVTTPAPGGGTSAAVPFNVVPPPTLTVSTTNTVGGSNVTVTLANGLGGAFDWLALAAAGAPDTSYIQSTFVGGGVTNRTWTVAMPAAGGTYQFRLFLNNGYTRAATSPTVTVQPGAAPSITVSATNVVGGATVTATLTNSPGGSGDWLALAAAGSPDTSSVQWTYVGAGVTTRTWAVTMPIAGGTYEFRLFLNNTYTRAATSPQIAVQPGGPTPSLSVSATTVKPGASVTVTLTNGGGGNTDWLALAAVGAPNTTYVQWTYVGAGVTTRTWTVTMPATAGNYEFRLFLNNGYTRAATSATIAVSP